MENLIKIVDIPTVKTSELLAQCKKKFDVYSFYSDKQLDRDFPPPKEQTIRYFKKQVEADEEHKNKSANDLEREKIIGITLRERLIFELEYYNETGKHLDIDNITLCSGSRNSDGSVPCVHWYTDDRRVCVGWFYPSGSSSVVRARAVVSNPLSSKLEPSIHLPTEFKKINDKLDKLLNNFGLEKLGNKKKK